ncbi:hypothetical protein EVAR_33888_1 [Eumeta japonica]|uniref:Uncharacterized protein n=1 Tax=Eumeta variegata TaxID=151549 RepID=A0A4C1WLW7_EUMVA|nr:hypothetical protein EVAR_33888_1 [Eumeta japonica]
MASDARSMCPPDAQLDEGARVRPRTPGVAARASITCGCSASGAKLKVLWDSKDLQLIYYHGVTRGVCQVRQDDWGVTAHPSVNVHVYIAVFSGLREFLEDVHLELSILHYVNRGANVQAHHQRVDGYCRPWTIANTEESPAGLPAAWEGIGYVMEGDRVNDGGERGMAYRNFHSLDESQ